MVKYVNLQRTFSIKLLQGGNSMCTHREGSVEGVLLGKYIVNVKVLKSRIMAKV